MNWRSIIVLVVLTRAGNVAGQSLTVYPGDVTNNGEVNNLDFLHLGMAYNFAGPARDSATLTFVPLPATPWTYQFASGLNMAYADCNGDGVVNYYYDAFPLYSNYGQHRNSGVIPDVFLPGVPGIDPPLQFDSAAVPAEVQSGQHVRLPIELGTFENPVEDLYGIAFSMVVDPQIVDPSSVAFNLSESSWANPDNDRIWMYKKVSGQRVDVGWVRTDQNQKRGFGRVGYVDFVIVVDILPLQQQFPISLGNIKMMDKFGNYAAVAGDTIWLTVPPDSALSGTHLPVGEPQVSVTPNPADDQILIRTDDHINDILLADLLGQVVYSDHRHGGNRETVHLPSNIPSGSYMLRVETDQGAVFKRIILR